MYKTTHCIYPGDDKMRDTTRLPKRRREQKNLVENNDGTVSTRSVGRPLKHLKLVKQATLDMFTEEKRHGGGRSCLCGDLTILQYHDSKMYRTGKERNCVVCGEKCIAYCTACKDKPYMHWQVVRGPNKGRQCFLEYHNTSHYGLCRDDSKMFGIAKKSWCEPTAAQVRENRRHIHSLQEEYESIN